MLDADIIKPAPSRWSSPVVWIQKENGELQFCIDYRVNSITVRNVNPLQRIDDFFDHFGGQYINVSTWKGDTGKFQLMKPANPKRLLS